jgi:Ca-activated chloride channel family protein
VGIGTPEGHTIPIRNKDGTITLKTDADGRVVRTFLNEEVLRRVAEDTDGKYFAQYQSNQPFASVILDELETIHRLEAFEDVLVEYNSRYQLPLLAAVVLLLVEVSLSERRRVREARVQASLQQRSASIQKAA